MHRGKIVEDGPHETLLARGGMYARLYRHQLATRPE
jgi:ABC-type multidrug transport system fused ATPase/permease subunit